MQLSCNFLGGCQLCQFYRGDIARLLQPPCPTNSEAEHIFPAGTEDQAGPSGSQLLHAQVKLSENLALRENHTCTPSSWETFQFLAGWSALRLLLMLEHPHSLQLSCDPWSHSSCCTRTPHTHICLPIERPSTRRS